jgi:DNA-binding beta-propeller fold protein YncE
MSSARARYFLESLGTALAIGWLLSTGPAGVAAEYLVSDRANNRILAFDVVTGAYTRTVVSVGLDEPSALAIDPDGSLYVANTPAGNVLAVNPATGATSPFASGLYGPGGLAWDEPSETVFVGEFGQFDGALIKRYDADGGDPIDTIGTAVPAAGRSGLALDGASNLYASSFGALPFFLGSVDKFTAASNYDTSAPFAGNPAILQGANGLAFDGSGNLYVAGLISQNVVKFTVTNGNANEGAQFGANLPYPSGLLFEDDDQSLLVTSLGNDNPNDPIYGNNIFPGTVLKYSIANGATQGFELHLAADFEPDREANAADLIVWRASYGPSPADGGDADLDGDTDGADFLAWQRELGVSLQTFQPTSIVRYDAAPAAGAVPEPAAAWLVCAAASVTGAATRKRRPSPLNTGR